jgi:hypothetical protein
MKARLGYVEIEDTDIPCQRCLAPNGIYSCVYMMMMKHETSFHRNTSRITILECGRAAHDKEQKT